MYRLFIVLFLLSFFGCNNRNSVRTWYYEQYEKKCYEYDSDVNDIMTNTVNSGYMCDIKKESGVNMYYCFRDDESEIIYYYFSENDCKLMKR